jgi:hypothetical protein
MNPHMDPPLTPSANEYKSYRDSAIEKNIIHILPLKPLLTHHDIQQYYPTKLQN